jgi:hypothetical protein
MTETSGEGIAYALEQIVRHAEQIGSLDTREAAHFTEAGRRLSALATDIRGMKGTLTDQAEILRSLDGAADILAQLSLDVASLLPPEPPPGGHRPAPTVRWWANPKTADATAERRTDLARIRAWVRDVYRPMYGHQSAPLGECWEKHDYCLMVFDGLSEHWCVLYVPALRSQGLVGAQSDFATRILPVAARELARETSKCEHALAAVNRDGGKR